MNLPKIDQKITHIVLHKGDIETLGYFSTELAYYFEACGYQVYLFDFLNEIPSMLGLSAFVSPGHTAFVTFNYTGLIGETCFKMNDDKRIWDVADIHCVNIVVDHPFYYHKFMHLLPKNYFQYNIDQSHVRYMKRFFPQVPVEYLPLAGTQLQKNLMPYEKRPIDIIFTGNYTPPKTFETWITRLDDDYTAFYNGILDDLITTPDQNIDDVIERHVRKTIPDADEAGIRDVMPSMIFLDLYVRFYFRGLAVKTLADAGLTVECYGAGWDLLECEHPENIIKHGNVDSETCLAQIGRSKISLNVMPWFKEGAHDRVFNSILNGAVCVSDVSNYLCEELEDQKEICYYHLDQMDQLPLIVKELLAHPEKAKAMTAAGYEKVNRDHTWKQRADVIMKHLELI